MKVPNPETESVFLNLAFVWNSSSQEAGKLILFYRAVWYEAALFKAAQELTTGTLRQGENQWEIKFHTSLLSYFYKQALTIASIPSHDE